MRAVVEEVAGPRALLRGKRFAGWCLLDGAVVGEILHVELDVPGPLPWSRVVRVDDTVADIDAPAPGLVLVAEVVDLADDVLTLRSLDGSLTLVEMAPGGDPVRPGEWLRLDLTDVVAYPYSL